ncbi:MAG TPA: endonuclease/exonuclease/phosphatase family protein, partial [Anaerolineales bacterium]
QNSQAQRIQQAGAVNAFVHHILTLDPLANVIVLGDFNDFPFSTSLAALQGGILTNVLDQIPEAERYTYIFEGNSQALDHILVSDNLLQTSLDEVDIVHLNAEFAEATRPTDHDPVMARFSFEEIRHAIYLPILSRATPPE